MQHDHHSIGVDADDLSSCLREPGDDSMADFEEAGFTHSAEPLILRHDARRLPKLESQASA